MISEAIRPDPSPEVLSWLDELPEEQVYVPSLVIGELQKGVDLLPDRNKRRTLKVWLEQLRERFHGRIPGFDEETVVTWGALTARLQ